MPVRNGGEDFRRCLDAIAAQEIDDEVEIVVVDSSSTDGSVELARSYGARVQVIPAEEFNHGATRNLGVSLARGDVLAFTSHDAYATGCDWLARLVAPLREDPEGTLAGTYGRQIPHVDARPPERYFLDFLYGPAPRLQSVSGPDDLSMQTTLFSNVNAAVRRSVMDRFSFVDDIILSEDQEWSRRVLLAGHSLAYVPAAAVHHSHPYNLAQAFRRFFDSGASAERAYLAGARPSAAVLRREALRYARGEVGWLLRTGQARWLPYTIVYEGTKFLGLQLGIHHRRLPLWLKLRLSGQPVYWTRFHAEP